MKLWKQGSADDDPDAWDEDDLLRWSGGESFKDGGDFPIGNIWYNDRRLRTKFQKLGKPPGRTTPVYTRGSVEKFLAGFYALKNRLDISPTLEVPIDSPYSLNRGWLDKVVYRDNTNLSIPAGTRIIGPIKDVLKNATYVETRQAALDSINEVLETDDDVTISSLAVAASVAAPVVARPTYNMNSTNQMQVYHFRCLLSMK